MRHLHSFKMKLQKGNAKMTLYSFSLVLFPPPLVSALPCLPLSFFFLLLLFIFFPFSPVLFSVTYLEVKIQPCSRGNDFLIKDR